MQRSTTSSRQRAQQVLTELRGRSTTGDEVPASKRQRSVWMLLAEFWQLMRGQQRAVLMALLLGTVGTILGLVPPAATKFIIDNVLGKEPFPPWLASWSRVVTGTSATVLDRPAARGPLLATILGVVLIVAVSKASISLWARWIATRATKRLQLSVRRQAFEHAVRLPLHRVHALKSGGAASLLREDAGSVGELIFGLFFNPCRAVVQLAGSLCILAWVDWTLLVGGIALLPIVYVTHRTWIGRIRPLYRASRKSRQLLDAQTTETFGGMRVVRAFGRQQSEAARFVRSNNLVIRQELQVWWSSRMIELLWAMLIPLASMGLLWYGGTQVMAGQLSLGELMMFLVYLLMLLEPLAILAESAAALQNSLAALDRVLDLLAEPRELATATTFTRSLDRGQVRGEIELIDVSFAYPGTSSAVIGDVSLHVSAGQTVALVGPSGAGKTTLCNLVARFYDPTAGTIRLDGVDLREYDVEHYRRLLGIVEQDVFLFDGTIAENIAFGRPSATDAELIAAAEMANAAEFIDRLPKGYDTLIGERGVKLSGGQRQRLAIARAILADPKILILDEATSNLDTESEQLIQQGLGRLMTHRTSFIIAHRLSTIRHADLILVLEGGRVIEAGSHAELLSTTSRYRQMIELQSSTAEAWDVE